MYTHACVHALHLSFSPPRSCAHTHTSMLTLSPSFTPIPQHTHTNTQLQSPPLRSPGEPKGLFWEVGSGLGRLHGRPFPETEEVYREMPPCLQTALQNSTVAFSFISCPLLWQGNLMGFLTVSLCVPGMQATVGRPQWVDGVKRCERGYKQWLSPI